MTSRVVLHCSLACPTCFALHCRLSPEPDRVPVLATARLHHHFALCSFCSCMLPSPQCSWCTLSFHFCLVPAVAQEENEASEAQAQKAEEQVDRHLSWGSVRI